MAKRGPAKQAITEFASCNTPSRLEARTANPILMTPINVAIDLVITSCRFWRTAFSAGTSEGPYDEDVKGLPPKEILSALLASELAIPNATNTSSQITAAKEFNPDDKVLKIIESEKIFAY